MRQPYFSTAESDYSEKAHPEPHLRAYRLQHHELPLFAPSGNITSELEAKAYVNEGRWVVDCPCEGCSSAQLASFEEKLYFCADCGNAQVNHDYIPVTWPSQVEDIEAALAVRPKENRNWETGEKVDALREENKAHDLPEAVE
jgi:hypothetical protein